MPNSFVLAGHAPAISLFRFEGPLVAPARVMH
jgi:hypothetical protein